MEGLQAAQDCTVGDQFVPDQGGGMTDFDQSALAFPVFLPRCKVGLRNNALGLLVEKGREQDMIK